MSTVEVWVASTASLDSAGPACSPAEHARAARFRSDEAGRRWLVGRHALRLVVGGALGVDPTTLAFDEQDGGKPVLGCHPGTHISFSRSDLLIAVALAGRPVGVDIEVDRRLVQADRLAERLFDDPKAFTAWRAAPDRTHALLRQWTRTEALLKATGEGIGGGIRGAETRLRRAGWNVRSLDLGPGVNAAVAAHGEDWIVEGPRRWPAGSEVRPDSRGPSGGRPGSSPG